MPCIAPATALVCMLASVLMGSMGEAVASTAGVDCATDMLPPEIDGRAPLPGAAAVVGSALPPPVLPRRPPPPPPPGKLVRRPCGLLPPAGGSCVWEPSYEVTSLRESAPERSTCFLTLHPGNVHL